MGDGTPGATPLSSRPCSLDVMPPQTTAQRRPPASPPLRHEATLGRGIRQGETSSHAEHERLRITAAHHGGYSGSRRLDAGRISCDHDLAIAWPNSERPAPTPREGLRRQIPVQRRDVPFPSGGHFPAS